MYDYKVGDCNHDTGPVNCYVDVQSMAAMFECYSVLWEMQYGAKSGALKYFILDMASKVFNTRYIITLEPVMYVAGHIRQKVNF